MINTIFNKNNKRQGFTIVELLVVIGIIGVLATISVVGYGSWRTSIAASQVKSDLNALASALENARTFGNAYPTALSQLSTTYTTTTGVTVTPFAMTATEFCFDAISSTVSGVAFYLASETKEQGAISGTCATRSTLPLPGLPGSIAVTSVAFTSVSLSWAPSSNAVTYTAQCATDAAFIVALRTTQITAPAVVATITGLSLGTSYFCRVNASNAAGTSGWSASVTLTTIDSSAPSDLAVAIVSSTQINYSWTAKSGAASYNLQFSTDPSFAAGVTTVNQAGVSGSSTSLSPNTTYHYRVRAVMPLGEIGVWSASVSATTINQGAVTTLAGSGVPGFANGTGASAQFNNPRGIAVNSAGTIYVADQANHRIRAITPAGVVTTLAGSGVPGSTDGTGASAQFNNPVGIAVNSAGTIYVADQTNHRIRAITPAGVVTTLAGSGVAGSTNGTGTAAQFNNPVGIAVNSAGTIYVADLTNHRIRAITPAGVVTSLAGNFSGIGGFSEGTGSGARFNNPVGVAVNSAGTVYVGDQTNQRIRTITPAGVVTTLAGSAFGFADGTGASALFRDPNGVAVDSADAVNVADFSNHRIRSITPAGVVTTLAGSGVAGFANGTGTAAQFNNPTGVAVNSAGIVYVADFSNHRIRAVQ